jgi:putative PIN family toxin of toxin-antitoxin system
LADSRRIIQACKQSRFHIIVSQDILNEYLNVTEDLMRTYPAVNGIDALKSVISLSEMTVSLAFPSQVCIDKDDDKFLAAAIASTAGIIISGDDHLKALSGWSGIRILSPRQFVSEFLETK